MDVPRPKTQCKTKCNSILVYLLSLVKTVNSVWLIAKARCCNVTKHYCKLCGWTAENPLWWNFVKQAVVLEYTCLHDVLELSKFQILEIELLCFPDSSRKTHNFIVSPLNERGRTCQSNIHKLQFFFSNSVTPLPPSISPVLTRNLYYLFCCDDRWLIYIKTGCGLGSWHKCKKLQQSFMNKPRLMFFFFLLLCTIWLYKHLALLSCLDSDIGNRAAKVTCLEGRGYCLLWKCFCP